MAPHSSTLAWRIPWTEEPGRLQSMGSLRVGQDWATSLSLFTFMHRRRKWQPTPVFFAWRIPGMAEPGGLPSMGSHRVGHNWSDLAVAAIISHDEHLLIYLLAISMSSLKKGLFRSFAHFVVWVVCFFDIWCELFLYFGSEAPCQSHHLQIFSSVLWVVFSFHLWFPLLCKSFEVWLGPTLFLLLFLLPWETDLRKHWYDLPQRMFCLCSFLEVLWCCVSYLSP